MEKSEEVENKSSKPLKGGKLPKAVPFVLGILFTERMSTNGISGKFSENFCLVLCNDFSSDFGAFHESQIKL
jgi:hypothetical protein